ncbi:unnamed protein product [Penicillium salamii]|nr:unnamed protein product [Penicillium salamii]CAG8270831.1 unnamed protein product [Penicillium salamii]CAG8404937.1 unnamed protein product [Penicillium salamii]
MQPWNNQIRLLLSFSPSHKSDISKMSAQRQVVNSDQAPPPRPFYNQAVIANGFVFCSGQLPKDSNGKIVQGNVQDRAEQCIKNLKAVLESAGSSLNKMVEVNVFLADMEDFEKMNEVYMKWFGEIKPVRTCVAVKSIPEYTDVEMKCVALV